MLGSPGFLWQEKHAVGASISVFLRFPAAPGAGGHGGGRSYRFQESPGDHVLFQVL